MIWRSIIIIFVHATIALLVWSGYCWLTEGHGLNPLIAFPMAFILYIWHILWIQLMCYEHQVRKEDLLEYLEERLGE